MSNFKELLNEVRELAVDLEKYEDVQLKLDMLEGETDYLGWLDWMFDKIEKEKAMEQSIRDRIDSLKARKQASSNRQDKFKDMMHMLLNATGSDKVSMPEFTIYKRAGSYSLEITDENLVPKEYKKITESIDKRKLKDAISNSEVEVGGARLVQGPETITIRSK